MQPLSESSAEVFSRLRALFSPPLDSGLRAELPLRAAAERSDTFEPLPVDAESSRSDSPHDRDDLNLLRLSLLPWKLTTESELECFGGFFLVF